MGLKIIRRLAVAEILRRRLAVVVRVLRKPPYVNRAELT
jgi:hypothetical protein